jgi:hypothetical protein
MLGPALLWAMQLLVAYSAEEVGCSEGSQVRAILGLDINVVGLGVSVVALVGTIWCGLLAAGAVRRLRQESSAERRVGERSLLMARMGVYSAIYFGTIIVFGTLAVALLQECL